ncbi:hypothetical protein [Thalassomonas actiniarum]|uniref:Uncharacterized protein n=1 Tax=Thalassomonas actiniarum TaxID=485447 RepID=A0AAE9YVB1_9GAMM|nr:hypothetical protein [Thalassomonas actiniarum]WDE00994.1 hypothetical protein SG35_010380 [Thalassomonas actiniarum]
MDLNTLIHQCFTLTDSEQARAFYQLSKAVKVIEESGRPKQFKPLEAVLPELAPYLTHRGESTLDGCTISIFRRVTITPETISQLLALADTGHHDLVIEALGRVSKKLWSKDIEQCICKALTHKDTLLQAAYALYVNAGLLTESASVDALIEVAKHANQVVSDKTPIIMATDHALLALGLLTRGKLKAQVIPALQGFIDEKNEQEKAEIKKTLSSVSAKGLVFTG